MAVHEVHPRPSPRDRAYWVEPGRLMAGAYPGEYDAADTRRNLREFVESGIRSFVTLMEAREESSEARAQPAYAPILREVGARLDVEIECRRFPIHDMSVPSPERAAEILAALDDCNARGLPVYLHCWAGRGRTGLVVGLHLIRRGLATPDNFVDVIRELRGREGEVGRSPETEEQVAFVRRYARGL